MARFCEYCGKDITETGVCDCPESIAAAAAKVSGQTEETNGSDKMAAAKEATGKLGALLLKFIKKPVTTMKEECKEENFVSALIILIVKDLIAGIAGGISMGRSMGAYYAFMGGGSGFATGFGFFWKILLLGLVADALLILLFFAFAKVFKGKTTLKKLTVEYGLVSSISVEGCILGTLFSILWAPLGMLISVVFSLAVFIYTCKGFAIAVEIEEEKRFYALILAFTSLVVLAMLVGGAILRSVLGSLGGLLGGF